MIKSPVLVIVVLAVVGCATDSAYQKTTAEFTGCSADDIQISDVNTSGSNTWKSDLPEQRQDIQVQQRRMH